MFSAMTPFTVPDDMTQLLRASSQDVRLASEELLPLVYDELRRVALTKIAMERPGQTLQATALVHEAWLELSRDENRCWENRAHFFGAAANAMRRILMLKARRKSRLKHGGGLAPLDIDDVDVPASDPDDTILLINEALERLEEEDPEQARVVVLKFFGGLTNEQVAAHLGTSVRSVDRLWACAKAWLAKWTRKQV
jgi:RNA polymerase sigma factor (TIGR02999 family)